MDQEPPYQELQYLRDELNQRVSSHSEHANKTINIVLIIWGGALIILGKNGSEFTEICLENISLHFMLATIFFISNLILYYMVRKYCNSIDETFKLAAYITVFYEKRPSKTVKVGKNFSRDLAIFEIMACDDAQKAEHGKSTYKKYAEYEMLITVSCMLILIPLALLLVDIFKTSEIERLACIITFSICVIYFVVSICLRWKIPKYILPIRDEYGMRARHLKDYIQYALGTEHDTEQSLKDRLGYVWDLAEAKCGTIEKKE